MSLRQGLLGLLVGKPASGYELGKLFEGALGRFAWQAQQSQIYPELRKLTEDGLITVVAEGARGRKTYAATEAGRVAFKSWMMSAPDGGNNRSEFILRLFLVSALDSDEAKLLLTGYAEAAKAQLVGIRAFLAENEPNWEENPLDYGHLAADYSLRTLGAIQEWAEAAVQRIDATDSSDRMETLPSP